MSKLIKKFSLLLIVAVIVTSFDVSAFAAVSEEVVTDNTVEVTTSENLVPGLYVVSPCDAVDVRNAYAQYFILDDMSQAVTFKLCGAVLGKWNNPTSKKFVKTVSKTNDECTVVFKRPGMYTFSVIAKLNDGHYKKFERMIWVGAPTPVYKAKVGKKKMLTTCEPTIALRLPEKKAKATKVNLCMGPDSTKKINKMYSAKCFPKHMWDLIKVEIADTSIVSGAYLAKKNTLSLVPKNIGSTDVTFKIGDIYAKTFKVIVE